MKLYNTLSGNTETFHPIDDTVKMYVCGMTPYAPPHVGHAMKAVVFDVIRRYLEYIGHKVRHVENFTDIDDKMISRAAKLGVSTRELAERNMQVYLEEMDALNVLRAHVYPRATQEVPSICHMIDVLLQKGFAYVVEGDVYFRVRADKDYGKLSRRSLDNMRAGARVEINESKEDPMDFLLWKSHKPGEPSWETSWGPGRPGWHIECSAMSINYLGMPLDIHGGGLDLVFPHHENEIAQTESYAGSGPAARFWVHNGLLRLGEDKMSKSLGNFVTVAQALQRFSSDAIRMFFLSSHYRSPLTYSDEGVMAQERAAERLRNAVRPTETPDHGPALETEPYRDRFTTAMDDDMNTPRALGVLFDLARETNRAREGNLDVADAQNTLRELSSVLGLTLQSPSGKREDSFLPLYRLLFDTHAELRAAGSHDLADRIGARSKEILGESESASAIELPEDPGEVSGTDIDPLIRLLIETRSELRAARRYDMADRVRQRLADLGFALEDTTRGTEWKRIVS